MTWTQKYASVLFLIGAFVMSGILVGFVRLLTH